MDLNTLRQNDSSVVDILHPKTGVPTGISITLASQDSEEIQAAILADANKRIKTAATAGRMVATAEERQASGLELLVKATLAWEGVEMKGAPLDCTQDNVRTLYADPAFAWLRKQVDAAFGDSSRFFES